MACLTNMTKNFFYFLIALTMNIASLKSAAHHMGDDTVAPPPNQECVEIKGLKQILPFGEIYGIDMHGTIVEQVVDETIAFPKAWEAMELLKKEGKKVFLVTNFFGTKKDLEGYLAGVGKSLDLFDAVITAGDYLEPLLKENGLLNARARVWGREFLKYVRYEKILEEVPEGEDYKVLLCGRAVCRLPKDTDYDIFRDNPEWAEELQEAAKAGKVMLTCSLDSIVKQTVDGHTYAAVAQGYFAKKFAEFGGKVLAPGKPGEIMLRALLEKAGDVPPDQIIMIGDSWEADMPFGGNQIKHILIRNTGNADLTTPLMVKKSNPMPDYVMNEMRFYPNRG